MATYNDREPRRSSGSRPVRTSTGTRPGAARPAGKSQGKPSAGKRPTQGRRPAPRRRRRHAEPRLFVLAATILIVLVIALVVFFASSGYRGKDVQVQATPTVPPASSGMSNATIVSSEPELSVDFADGQVTANLAGNENEEDNTPRLSAADQSQFSPEDLSVNTSLPEEWLNVLLLGTDERSLNEPARTDAMIIASINRKTGQVKLTSLLRDTAVEFQNVGQYSGTYRLNAANYFGGPYYAIKIINECLNLNIQHYVSVNFYGFTKVAEALGGIDVDITEAEMNEINDKQVYQAAIAAAVGVDESGIPNEYLETYGANTHLNGRQTLAYARVRYVDNDLARAERQRTVIIKLTEKLRGKSAMEILALVGSLSSSITTNMDLNTVGELAITVLSSGMSNISTLRLPENGTYKIERRNNQEMLYDTDWNHNSLQLYNFIYG